MADAFIGEIRAFPYTFTPAGWLTCDGSLHSIQQFQALAAVIGITYGGDAKTTFAVPNLNGRVVLGYSNTVTGAGGPYPVAATLGQAVVTLTNSQIPTHDHSMVSQISPVRVTAPGSTAVPFNPQYLPPGNTRVYGLGMYANATLNPTLGTMAPTALSVAGGNTGHENRSPLLVMRYCICFDGEWPARN
jgi:microcystin-dependent protein